MIKTLDPCSCFLVSDVYSIGASILASWKVCLEIPLVSGQINKVNFYGEEDYRFLSAYSLWTHKSIAVSETVQELLSKPSGLATNHRAFGYTILHTKPWTTQQVSSFL